MPPKAKQPAKTDEPQAGMAAEAAAGEQTGDPSVTNDVPVANTQGRAESVREAFVPVYPPHPGEGVQWPPCAASYLLGAPEDDPTLIRLKEIFEQRSNASKKGCDGVWVQDVKECMVAIQAGEDLRDWGQPDPETGEGAKR